MDTTSFDPGLTQQYTVRLRRAINKDGSFNLRRRGSRLRDIHPYLHLINMSWPYFLATVVFGYVATNLLFAAVYWGLGPGQLASVNTAGSVAGRFLDAFYFSAQTLTTVGYGTIAPRGMAANMVATFEALLGWLGFALAAGLLFGRVSRPSARIGFSPQMIVAPYQGGSSLQFRIVNRRVNSLMEVEAMVMLMTVQGPAGQLKRAYDLLKLERNKIVFLPLTWTVVHPIDSDSPLFGKTPADLERLQAEVLILIKAYDDTFSQMVHTRQSYRYDEIVWSARFAPSFEFSQEGDMVLHIDRVGVYEPLERTAGQ
jgi:inward rectifier potassium channel